MQAYLPTVEAAELLLAAFRDPQAVVAGKRAHALRTAGLLDEALRYRPASDELARQVSELTGLIFLLYGFIFE